MLNTNTQDLKANTSSNGKSILAVTADTVNPNGGFLIGISQPSNPNPIVFGHDKTAFVIDTLNDACDFAFYGEKTHAKLMKRRLEQDIERGVERPDAVISAVWHKDSDTYTVSAITGTQADDNEVTGMSFVDILPPLSTSSSVGF